jgi:hypothetical protein
VRRRRDLQSVGDRVSSVAEEDFRALSWFGMASERPSPMARISDEIRAEASRLHSTPLTVETRFELLLRFITELGHREGFPRLGESAERHVAHLRAARDRWQTGRRHARQGG